MVEEGCVGDGSEIGCFGWGMVVFGGFGSFLWVGLEGVFYGFFYFRILGFC